MNSMQDLKQALVTFHNDQDGATSTEYIIVLILIACIIIGIVAAFGSVLSKKFQSAKDNVDVKVTTN